MTDLVFTYIDKENYSILHEALEKYFPHICNLSVNHPVKENIVAKIPIFFTDILELARDLHSLPLSKEQRKGWYMETDSGYKFSGATNRWLPETAVYCKLRIHDIHNPDSRYKKIFTQAIKESACISKENALIIADRIYNTVRESKLVYEEDDLLLIPEVFEAYTPFVVHYKLTPKCAIVHKDADIRESMEVIVEQLKVIEAIDNDRLAEIEDLKQQLESEKKSHSKTKLLIAIALKEINTYL